VPAACSFDFSRTSIRAEQAFAMGDKERAPHVLAVGYSSLDWIYRVDRLPDVGQTARILISRLRPAPGGCAANIAVACVRLGLRAGVLTAVGDDAQGRGYVAALKARGVETQGIIFIHGGRSPSCFLFVDPSGHHMTFYDPGFSERRRFALWIPMAWRRSLQLGVITVGSPAMVRKAAFWFQRHRVPILWSLKGDPRAWPPSLLDWLARHSQVILMNRMEALWLQNALRIKEWHDLLLGSVQAVVITAGSEGSQVLDREGWKSVPAVPPRRLVDPTGAGDAFASGFLWGWIHGLSAERCARVGAVVASFVLEAWGAQEGLPTLAQVRRRYHSFFNEPLDLHVRGGYE